MRKTEVRFRSDPFLQPFERKGRLRAVIAIRGKEASDTVAGQVKSQILHPADINERRQAPNSKQNQSQSLAIQAFAPKADGLPHFRFGGKRMTKQIRRFQGRQRGRTVFDQIFFKRILHTRIHPPFPAYKTPQKLVFPNLRS